MSREHFLRMLICGWLSLAGGCHLVLPETAIKPVIRNPFPQLSRVAVAPFFNQSDESTVDGAAVAIAYFAELQSTPGFEVVPVTVVEEAMIQHQIDLSGPGEARRLAKILGVDAVAVGSITDFSPYYPPRFGLRVEWYAANRGYHEIPAGYGLPWNTPEEEFIPDSLVYASQMALARSQMRSLDPDCEGAIRQLPDPPSAAVDPSWSENASRSAPLTTASDLRVVQHQQPADSVEVGASVSTSRTSDPSDAVATTGVPGAACTSDACAAAQGCFGGPPPCIPYDGPVVAHTRIYKGDDPEFAEAMRGYSFFRDDLRLGGWRAYLRRTDDFVRVCCHMHISEMLSARGGGRKTGVVWRWPESR